MSKTIIVPVDLAHADRAMAMIDAAHNLGGADATIILVNVIEDVPTYIAAELPGGILDKFKADNVSALNQIAADAGIEADVEVRSGQAATAILSIAQERGADAIVIASHRPGLSDYFLGSTAARVVRHAECSVLVVR
jgi:universal stress protein F